MPPKLNSTNHTNRKPVILNQTFISKKKQFSYDEDMQLKFLKNYIEERTSPKKHPYKHRHFNKKTHSSRQQQKNIPSTNPIEEQQHESQNDSQSQLESPKPKSLSQKKQKKQSKQPKEPPKKRTYVQQVLNLVHNRASLKRVSDATPQERSSALKAYMKLISQVGMDTNIPPYYTRMTTCNQEQTLKLIKKKSEIARMVFEQNKIYPILFPQPGKLTEKMKKNMISSVDYNERCQKPKERDFKSMYKKIEPKDQNMDDSAYINEIPELADQSSEYVVENVVIKLRHKKDLPKYYEEGFKRLYEDIPKGLPIEAYASLEKFNEANFHTFSTLDANYYRSLDERNAGFSGYLQTDEPYTEDMPFDCLFPELAQLFGFPQTLNDSLAEDPNEDDEEDWKLQRQQQDHRNKGHMNEKEKEQENGSQQRKYINYYDQAPMEREDFNFIKQRVMKEFENFKKKNLNKMFYNKYKGKQTNRWDYYAGDQRFESEQEEQAKSFFEDSMNYSRTQTMQLPIQSKTKTIEPKSKANLKAQKKGSIQPGKKGNIFTDKKSKIASEIEMKNKKYETKTKLRQIKEKVDYDQISESESEWEDI